jgi:hypothetical protein
VSRGAYYYWILNKIKEGSLKAAFFFLKQEIESNSYFVLTSLKTTLLNYSCEKDFMEMQCFQWGKIYGSI